MKYKSKQIASGQYAVFANAKEYWTNEVYNTKHEADIAAIQHSARWYQEQIDKCDKELDKLGALDHEDPHGYMC